ncbi:MAG: DNA repair protein RecO [Clostridioides sp.]|jgi:DNA repair protein RecO (recombination protein O)|nr:DNA repair protein RecO [Clostridioides sp.]
MIAGMSTEGIVLRTVKYKENDVILTIFTRKLGKVSAIAKGARRVKSPLLSSSQLFSYSNFTLKQQGNMYRVAQADTIKNFYNISYDFDAFSYASYVVRLVENSIFENQTNLRLFILLAQVLYLFTASKADKKYLTSVFELKFLDFTGFRPVVDSCVACGANKYGRYVFNVEAGGIICSDCSENFEQNMKVDPTTVKLMQYILASDISTCAKANVSKYIADELDRVLMRYLQVHVGNINIKSLQLLKSANAYNTDITTTINTMDNHNSDDESVEDNSIT